MPTHNPKPTGFTLLELMITLAIIAILATTSYPYYQSYMTRTRRTEGRVELMDLALHMEEYYATNHTYLGASLSNVGSQTTSPHGFYLLEIAVDALKPDHYVIKAIPTYTDNECGALSLDQTGKHNITGTGKIVDCW